MTATRGRLVMRPLHRRAPGAGPSPRLGGAKDLKKNIADLMAVGQHRPYRGDHSSPRRPIPSGRRSPELTRRTKRSATFDVNVSLAGKTAVITGAGSGIGRATVLKFLDAGAAGLVAVDRRADLAESLLA